MDDVEKEIDEYANHMESYVNALKSEIKARSNLISLLVHAETQLENDRKDVKLVANVSTKFLIYGITNYYSLIILLFHIIKITVSIYLIFMI